MAVFFLTFLTLSAFLLLPTNGVVIQLDNDNFDQVAWWARLCTPILECMCMHILMPYPLSEKFFLRGNRNETSAHYVGLVKPITFFLFLTTVCERREERLCGVLCTMYVNPPPLSTSHHPSHIPGLILWTWENDANSLLVLHTMFHLSQDAYV